MPAPPTAGPARPGAPADLLQAELDKAESVKAGGMALLLGLAILPILLFVLASGGAVDRAALRPGVVAAVLGLALALLGVELAAFLISRREVRAGRRLSRWPGYVLVGVEAASPTLALGLIGAFFPSAHALTAPQLLLYAVFIIPSAVRLNPRLSLMAGAISAASYLGLAVALVAGGGVDHPLEREPATHFMRVVYLLLTGAAAAFVAAQLRRRFTAALEAGLERARVVDIFGRYLHDDVVDRLLHAPDGLRLGGQRRELTVMMTDLRGFSAISEALPPERVVAMLNHFLGEVVPVVMAHGGTIDEIIGDALLVLWNAPSDQPDHARRALRCAVDLQRRMDAVRAWGLAQGLPPLEMGIGLHTGDAVVGNIGADRRQKYGVVGTTVNLAARVESITVGGQILATEATVARAGAGLRLGERRAFRPKGSEVELGVVEVLGVDGLLLDGADDALSPAAPLALTLRAVRGKTVDPTPLAATLRASSGRRLRATLDAGPGALDGVEDVSVELGGATAFARAQVEADGGLLLRLTSAAGAAALAAAGLPASPGSGPGAEAPGRGPAAD